MNAPVAKRITGLILALIGIGFAVMAIQSGLGQLNNPALRGSW